jgi:N,N'-diacetyllegionaminate synthase
MKSTYVIAEIGNTHEGSLGLAKQFIKAAAECGVDCVKFQTHIFEAESLPDAPNPPYFNDESRKEYFERTSFTLEEYLKLKAYASEMKVDFMSSPFSIEAIDLLEKVGVSAFKIPSGEVTNLPLLERAAQTGKRVILSSGMSSWEELDQAVTTLREHGCKDLYVLQCTSEYPCPPERAGMNLMLEMGKRFECKIGYSDHTLGVAIPLLAVANGATLVEKHFTLSKKMYGSDAKNSTEPEEFKFLVEQIRIMDKAINSPVDKNQILKDLGTMKTTFEKTIVAAADLPKGTVVTKDMLAYKKPMRGICANRYRELIGKKLQNPVKKDQVLRFEDLT